MIHSSTSARALARVMPDSAARRCRSQPKPSSATAQSSDGGVDLERRAGVADHDLAGEDEAAGIDLAGAGGVGGAQVLRRDQQPVGLAGGERPATSGWAVTRPTSAAQHAARQEHGQPGTFRDRNARHRSAVSPWRLSDRPVGVPARHWQWVEIRRFELDRRTIARMARLAADLRRLTFRSSQPGREKAVEAGHARIGIGQMAGQRAQVAGRRQPFGDDRATSAAVIGWRRKPRIAASRSRTIVDRLPRARASRCSRRACRPAWSVSTAWASSRRCRAASAAMSASRLSQGMSGWRRMVPVDEQGASSSTASNGPACHCGRVGGDGLGGEAEPGEIVPQPRRAAPASGRPRSTCGAGGGELRGLAARRGAEVGDRCGRARRRAAAPAARRRRPAPTRRLRRSRAAATPGRARPRAPSRSAARGRRAPSPNARGRLHREIERRLLAIGDARSRARSRRHRSRSSAPAASPACRARGVEAGEMLRALAGDPPQHGVDQAGIAGGAAVGAARAAPRDRPRHGRARRARGSARRRAAARSRPAARRPAGRARESGRAGAAACRAGAARVATSRAPARGRGRRARSSPGSRSVELLVERPAAAQHAVENVGGDAARGEAGGLGRIGRRPFMRHAPALRLVWMVIIPTGRDRWCCVRPRCPKGRAAVATQARPKLPAAAMQAAGPISAASRCSAAMRFSVAGWVENRLSMP